MESNKFIVIEADTNDGDYITKISKISDEDIILLKPVIDQLKLKKLREPLSPNWVTSEYSRYENPHDMYVKTGLLTKEQVDIFGGYIPRGEAGVHTIESIRYLIVTDDIKVF